MFLFFVYESTFAYVSGRGEFVLPIEIKLNYKIHLVKPDIGIKTKNAFSKLDEIKRAPFISEQKLLSIFNKGVSFWKESFFNDFEKIVVNNGLDSVKESTNFFLMSGSGSTYFEILENFQKPILIAKKGELDCMTTFY